MEDARTGEQVAARIGFAEQWLRRAKGEVADGHLARGVLILVLAQAEVRHAMEVAGVPVGRRRASVAPPLTITALAALAALAVLRLAAPAVPLTVEAGPPVVRLRAGVGDLLTLVAPSPPAGSAEVSSVDLRPASAVRPAGPAREAVRTPSATAAVRSRGASSSATRPPAPAPAQAAAPSSAPAAPLPAAAPSGAATAPSASVATPRPSILTTADLIDLVITAGDALRADPVGP